jgi:hypothetical protein
VFLVCEFMREPSELQAPIFAKRIHELTEGYIGEIAELLMRAAVKAIETKKERIDCVLLADLNWKPTQQLGSTRASRAGVLASIRSSLRLSSPISRTLRACATIAS